MAWQGRKQQQFTHLLCELWRDEESEIHVNINSIFFINSFPFVYLKGFTNRKRCD
jgi:hypothetical protein